MECRPGGETYRYFRRLVVRAVYRIAAHHAAQRVLIFTHAGVISQILGSITGQSAARWESLRPRNCSITEVLWTVDGASIECFNDRQHL